MDNHTFGPVRALLAAALLLAQAVLCGTLVGQEAAPPEGTVPLAAGRPVLGTLEGTLDPHLYILGPGDVLQIGFWGDVNRQESVAVNPSGEILVPPVGPLEVSGKTLAEVRDLVKSVLSDYYRPSILSVSLVSLRTFNVHVVGFVNSPGAVEVSGVTRVSQAVASAGGVLAGGSTRNIVVRRSGGTLRADLTGYLNIGDNTFNPFLSDGDEVYVPARGGLVHVYGSVGRPGTYEYVDGETLAGLLRLAGGFRPEAYTEEIEVERFDPKDSSTSVPILVGGERALLAGFGLEVGDRVFVRAIPGWQRSASVEIVGEVRFPGVYVIEDGTETLTGIISKAGGLTRDASLAEARLTRTTYERTRYPIEGELRVLENLQDGFSEKEKDLLKTMGRESKGRVSLSFEEIFLGKDGSKDALLYDGDVIEIPKVSNYVRVAGQIKNPGLVALVKGWDYSHYIAAAGGFAPDADRRSTTLIRGTSGVKIDPGGEEIYAGDVIWVPVRSERDWWEVTKDVLSIGAQLATIWLVIDSTSGH
jgi:polysaccharide export outer membrane protein